ncbi:TPA: type III secretion system ATPase SctN [Providencia alcalifaciens]|uniref:type III secretion system ATPase SctN n=1 Tax=Providencia TaxID=586 RepID=UPI0003E27BC4|nr:MULTISPECIES: type III secretion system ATPase SctN [Providencia]ETS99245.1 invasion protein InvC [Providencia alcalifaciens PAL-3]EUC99124.1 invasion protein InvC [Providencia alcalifaciens PAL-1]MTC22080.1 FliI/YscN family ATPase [Providencia sp. wls1938]HEF8785954.1 type III secretion system ATPase SctN [Providencia alcalifaciens]
MKSLRLLQKLAHPQRISGPILEAELPDVAIGELCNIRAHWQDDSVIARAQVVGLQRDCTVLSLIGNANGLTRNAVIVPTGRALSVPLGNFVLGSVIDPTGRIVERFASEIPSTKEERMIDVAPPEYFSRVGVNEPLVTGIRVIDGVLTCGVGQRIGIFASAGCGKTMLMHMLIDQTEADVFVIGLIGERGREVTEFVSTLQGSPKKDRCVLVFATSDFSSVDRCNAALLATTVAEFFRDQGKRVVLFIDSMTRYTRALRDVALAAGEAPARRGYPASVFDSLPRILERPGATHKGSITAFYTVLLEGEDEPDPMADEIRSILDGHFYLSRKLAGQGHYPAIDVLKSVSRVFGQITTEEHQSVAFNVRKLITKLDELQIFIDLGEYKHGENSENDFAMNMREPLKRWLCQPINQYSSFSDTLRGMYALS